MTTCPEHPTTALRPEYSSELGRTGFCSKCLTHYKLCSANYGTWACERLKDHTEAEHAFFRPDGSTTTWTAT